MKMKKIILDFVGEKKRKKKDKNKNIKSDEVIEKNEKESNEKYNEDEDF